MVLLLQLNHAAISSSVHWMPHSFLSSSSLMTVGGLPPGMVGTYDLVVVGAFIRRTIRNIKKPDHW